MTNDTEDLAQIRAVLHELCQILREVHRLEPQAHQALADLLQELARAIEPDAWTRDRDALGDSARRFARAIDEQSEAGLFSDARERMEEAAADVESRAPTATVLTQRLLETLASLGI